MNPSAIKILSIETSCDETAASVLAYSPARLASGLKAGSLPKITTLSSVIKSQIKLHSKMGGVVPEAAARAHLKYIRPVVELALKNKGLTIKDVDIFAVTQGPGLLPSLLIGVEFAKALAFATKKPLIPVNHMLGHLYSPFKDKKFNQSAGKSGTKNIFPNISLIVSGGHTILVLVKAIGDYKILGQTLDDAAGEAFDKIAKMLKLPYPGGPEVSKLADQGNPYAINFPRPMLTQKNYNFSFSGLKTAVLYYLKDNPLTVKNYKQKANLCAAFQQAVVDVLVAKTIRAAKEFNAKSVSLSGGVAANQLLRSTLAKETKKEGLIFLFPPMNLCTDNAEMIGLAAALMLYSGYKPKNYATVQANPNLSL